MAEPHEHSAETHDEHFALYIRVFVLLAICTLLSFLVLLIFGHGSNLGASIILLVAIVKASAVVWVFMHLKWDWRKVYFLIVPLMILCFMMIMVLMPDLVLAWR